MLASLQKAFAPKAQKVSVNLGDFLKKASIADLDHGAWPTSAFTDYVRDETEILRQKGIKMPFIYVDLQKKGHPQWALKLNEPVDKDDALTRVRALLDKDGTR